jgi:surfactin synthase thioesterase subunit
LPPLRAAHGKGHWVSTVEKWFPYRKGTGTFELFAIPHVGAASTVFNDLRGELAGDGVALSATVLPGHGRRIREKLHDRMDTLLAEFTDMAERDGYSAFSGNYGLLGSCSGALIAYEMAKVLVEAPCPNPQLLVACSGHAPARVRDSGMSKLSTTDLFARTASMGGTADALMLDQDFMSVLEPVLRADWAIYDGYVHQPAPKLPVPILAVRGNEDTQVNREDLLLWEDYTSERFMTAELASGHWALLGEGPAALAREIRAARSAVGTA